MHNWFECKVSYAKMLENGLQKKVTEPYLVDALSFTEAEARIIEEIRPFITGEFTVTDIKRARLSELFFNENGDRFYKIKVYFITLDEKSGAEKKTAAQMLAQASTLKEAIDVLEEGMKGTLADYTIASVAETQLMDVFPFDANRIPEEKKMHFDLEECAGQVLITFEKKINDKHLNVNVDMPEHPVYTMANPDYITQVIYNLIDNAVKFCPDGGNLGLRIKEGGSKAYVSVSNDGETIPPDELPLVFDRFHKLDKSRSQNRDGWGLGLYIVKTIVCSHGEDISVSSKDGKTEFTFTMPLVN